MELELHLSLISLPCLILSSQILLLLNGENSNMALALWKSVSMIRAAVILQSLKMTTNKILKIWKYFSTNKGKHIFINWKDPMLLTTEFLIKYIVHIYSQLLVFLTVNFS